MRRLGACCLLLLLLCGCAGAAVCAVEEGENSLRAVCEAYSGERSAEVNVGDNACISIQCGIEPKEGSLDILICDSEGTVAYEGQNVAEQMSFVVQLTAPGGYTISVDADQFTGSYSFDWETVGAAP